MKKDFTYNTSMGYESPKIEVLIIESKSAICDFSYLDGNHDGAENGGGF